MKPDDRHIISLLDLSLDIKKVLTEKFQGAFWVKAEMNQLNYYKHSGHCYPELVEKQDGKVVAQMRANLWKMDYFRINNQFRKVLGEPLKDGIKILFLATVSFEPAYGLALRIVDIDPSYTLGDLEREKQETIQRLEGEGIFDANKKLKLPLLPQRLAIISVETSKGYKDFLGKIEGNSWGYKFFHMLFPSLLQGDKIMQSITAQLKRIRKVMHHFDAVAIIRGGGGEVGLSSYNNCDLAREIALFPIPVLTGIGHITNETVVEMVSHKNLITPTDLANFLLQQYHNFSVPVNEAQRKVREMARQDIKDENEKFNAAVKLFRSSATSIIAGNKSSIQLYGNALVRQSRYLFNGQAQNIAALTGSIVKDTKSFCNIAKQDLEQMIFGMKKDMSADLNRLGLSLENMERNIANLSPENVLRRGYSITRVNGKAVKNASELREGDELKTALLEGEVTSIVRSTKQKNG